MASRGPLGYENFAHIGDKYVSQKDLTPEENAAFRERNNDRGGAFLNRYYSIHFDEFIKMLKRSQAIDFSSKNDEGRRPPGT